MTLFHIQVISWQLKMTFWLWRMKTIFSHIEFQILKTCKFANKEVKWPRNNQGRFIILMTADSRRYKTLNTIQRFIMRSMSTSIVIILIKALWMAEICLLTWVETSRWLFLTKQAVWLLIMHPRSLISQRTPNRTSQVTWRDILSRTTIT